MSVIRDLFTSSVNSTMMSINERFTYLQKNARPAQTAIITIRANNAASQQASAKNRRLAMQMERRLSAMAALKIKKKSIRQRLGVPLISISQGSNVRERLTLPVRGRGRSRNPGKGRRSRGRSLRRTQSMQSLQGGNLQRSRSMQSLNNNNNNNNNNSVAVPHRSRSRSRTRNRTPSVGPKEVVARQGRSTSRVRQGRLRKTINAGFARGQQAVSPRGRKRSNSISFVNSRRGRINGNQKEQRNMVFTRGGGGGGGRGSFRGGRGQGQFRRRDERGRSRGQTRNGKSGGSLPTKEQLDAELERYMANTKSQLDMDIDSYMKQNADGMDME